jgi:hypothetical protein
VSQRIASAERMAGSIALFAATGGRQTRRMPSVTQYQTENSSQCEQVKRRRSGESVAVTAAHPLSFLEPISGSRPARSLTGVGGASP